MTIQDGKGITALINNTGYAPATNITWSITVDGGLIFKGKETTGEINTLDIGDTSTITASPKGIGLGLFLPLPSITINLTCAEGVSLAKTIQAKILFSKITIQQ